MNRRAFLKASGSATLALAVGGCASRISPQMAPAATMRRRLVNLVPVACSMDRIIRTTVGLRPHRQSGFLLKAERLDEKTVIHNFGHGGAGMSLSWGTGFLAAELALAHTDRRAAVIGCGVVGLTSARQLQRRGFDVTIYSLDVPPNTTSNMSYANFTPASGLVSDRQGHGASSSDRWTPAWVEQFRRATEVSYRELQLLAGPRYGVSWLNSYQLLADAPTQPAPRPAYPQPTQDVGDALPDHGLRPVVWGPGSHPFGANYAVEWPAMRIEPSIYLEALMRDVISFGGRIIIRKFDTPRELGALSEPLIVNCTGLGAKALFGDTELVPVKGQLTVLVPQPEVTYMAGGAMPRSDGIVLGGTYEVGVSTLEVNEEAQRRIVERNAALFSAMRHPVGLA